MRQVRDRLDGEFEIDTLDNDKNGIIGNEAATDTITATDSNPISEERQTWQIIHHRLACKGFQWLFLVSSSSPLYSKIPVLQR